MKIPPQSSEQIHSYFVYFLTSWSLLRSSFMPHSLSSTHTFWELSWSLWLLLNITFMSRPLFCSIKLLFMAPYKESHCWPLPDKEPHSSASAINTFPKNCSHLGSPLYLSVMGKGLTSWTTVTQWSPLVTLLSIKLCSLHIT